MKVILEKNEQGIVSIFDEKKRLLRKFEFNDNLQKNLQLLRKINSLKTIEGVPIFKTKMIGGVSVWSFFQTNLFWHLLWNSTKYEELKKFLFENKITKVVIKQKGLRLENYLKLSGMNVYSGFDWRRPVKKFLSFFTKLLAQIITFLAILKIIIFKIEILTYTPDKFIKPYGCDFRFFKIYKFLRTKKVKFIEVFHTLLGGEFFKNIIFIALQESQDNI